MCNLHLVLIDWLGSLGSLGGLCPFGDTGGLDTLGNLGSWLVCRITLNETCFSQT